MKSPAFRRLASDIYKISPHLRLKRIKLGFYRIFFKHAYIHEVYEDMPWNGYDFETYDPRLENQSYYEEFEDNVELIRTVKNYVEGYYDAIDTIRRRTYMMRNDYEFYKNATSAYQQITVK